MSLSEWKTIYYPVPADQIETQAEALDHSILKWSGLRPKVLREYGIERYDYLLYARKEDRGFEVATKTCALCDLDSREVATKACTTCPLYKSRGNVACAVRCAHEATSPYDAFIKEGDPDDMLAALHKAKAWLEAQSCIHVRSQLQEGEATMVIIRKKTDPSVRVAVERLDPSEPKLTVDKFPWKREERITVAYYHRDEWEEAPPSIRNHWSGATATGVSRISSDGPGGPGWGKTSDAIVMHYYEKLGWENNT